MNKMNHKRSVSLWIAVILLLTSVLASGILSGCSSKNGDMRPAEQDSDGKTYQKEDYNSNVGSDTASKPDGEGNSQDQAGNIVQAPAVLSEEKLVYTCDMTVETTEYQKTASALKAKIKEFGGIIEAETETDSDTTWYYSNHTRYGATMRLILTIRIPSERYSEFLESAGSLGKVRQKAQHVQNISRRYSDTEARIKALETEEERLLEMLKKAQSVEEMLYVEERLTDVEYELSTQRSALSGMDLDVAYSTINITLTEVLEYTEEERPGVTFIQRVGNAFSDTWDFFKDFSEGFVIVLIYLIPFMILAAIVLAFIFIVRKAKDKKHPERVEARKARKEARQIRKYGKPAIPEKTEQSKE